MHAVSMKRYTFFIIVVIVYGHLRLFAGWTALHYAARWNQADALSMLIDLRANVNAETVEVCMHMYAQPLTDAITI
jgi:hypothetical protein